MLTRFGISFNQAGVSIAMGQNNAQEVVAAWLGSEQHREKILAPDFTTAGVGLSRCGEGSYYWVLIIISDISSANSETSGTDDAVLPVLRNCDKIEAKSSLCNDISFLLSGRR